MDDKAPDVFEFETLEVHPKTNENENNFILEEPPLAESDQQFPTVSDEINTKSIENIEEISDSLNNELLNLHEPPQEEDPKETTDVSNKLTDEAINQFAQNLIDPIVKEAIEIQKAEMEESISDEIKIDSSGDKKSEKSLSDDGFEYVKDDDINSSTNMDSNNEIQQHLFMECFNKDIEDESFLNESLKIDERCVQDELFSNDICKVEPGFDESQNYIENELCLGENVKSDDNPCHSTIMEKEDESCTSEDVKYDNESYLCKNLEKEDESCLSKDVEITEKSRDEITADSILSEDLKHEFNYYDDSIMKVSEDDSFVKELKHDFNFCDDSIMKVSEDDSFVKDISIEQAVYAPQCFAKAEETTEDIAPISQSEDPDYEKTDEFNDDDYEFDIQGIINASNMSELQSNSVETEEMLEIISRNNLSQKCKDIILWKNPIFSSIVLSAIMLIELGLMCDYSIISLLAYCGLLLLCSSFVYKFAVKFNLLKKCGQSNCAISITSEDIQKSVDYALKWLEYLFNEVRSLTYVVSFTKNLKAFIFFWILTYVGQWFNLLSLIFMGTITLFSLPIVYVSYEDTIDLALGQARGTLQDSINKLKLKFQSCFNRA